jgi:hypothetical protein
MSDDYLWDRSGEPDPEMERLEKALGKLRHQPQAASLAQIAPAVVRRPFFPALAAAAVILLMLAGGLWLALRRSINEEQNSPRVLIANPTPGLLAGKELTAPVNAPGVKAAGADQPPATIKSGIKRQDAPRRAIAETRLARNAARGATPNNNERDVMREGEEATEKLMMALRFASSKLNLVQKKIQVNKEGGPAS